MKSISTYLILSFFQRKPQTSHERAIICIGINNLQAMSHNRIYITFLFDNSYHASYRIIMDTSKHLDYRVNGSKNDNFYGFCLPCALSISNCMHFCVRGDKRTNFLLFYVEALRIFIGQNLKINNRHS